MKIIYISREPQSIKSGGSSVDSRNLHTLMDIYGENNIIIEYLPKTSLKSVLSSMLTLSSYGVSKKQEKEIIEKYRKINCKLAFIEGSFCGKLVRKLSKHGCRVIIHMHNVEKSLYQQKYKSQKSLISLVRYWFICYNESLSVKYASDIIALNNRDSEELYSIYNRRANLILPITFPQVVNDIPTTINNNYILFVGSDFFPNIEGISWFIKNVCPYISMNLKIVGGCCKNEAIISMKLPNNVTLEGYVDDIRSYYIKAAAVVCPIFSGSGMKTKTIEAMSYGKSIIGTSEAFMGIDCNYEKIGGLCNSATEFIEVINSKRFSFNNEYTKTLFNNEYTNDVFRQKLESYLK